MTDPAGDRVPYRGVFTPTRLPAENTAEKQRVRQQMLERNWHDDAISPELGSFCQKSQA